PDADWRFLLHTATNLAKAVACVHKEGCVVGDLNPNNAVVSAEGTVKLIDCDSIQVTIRDRTYSCPVGVPLFTAPELQGKPLRGVIRTQEQDNFALAVLVFHLLFLGRHPFAGMYAGRGDMPIEKAIAEHRFAYGADRARVSMSPPPHSLLLTDFPTSFAA